MRCPACRVDLNETAHVCPLCGGAALDIPPAIAGVVTQDYPEYRPRPEELNLSAVFIVACAVLFLLLRFLLPVQRDIPFFALAGLAVWALLVRPKARVDLSAGNYLVCAALCLSLPMLWAGHALHISAMPAIAAVTLAASLLLLFILLRYPGQRERNLIFPPVFALLAAGEFFIAVVRGQGIGIPAFALGASIFTVAMMDKLCGGAMKEEFAARLHI